MDTTIDNVDAVGVKRNRPGGFKYWVPAIVLMITVVLAFFDKISIAVLFADPEFLSDLGITGDKAKLGWLMSIFLLAYGLSSVFLSFVGDIFGPKKILLAGITSWGVLMFLMGLTSNFYLLLFYRVLLGIAEGPLLALCFSIVKQNYTPSEQARASTLFLLGTPIGAALGFPLTAIILQNYNWHATFFFMSFITLFLLVLVYFGLKGVTYVKANRKSVDHKTNFKKLLSSRPFWLLTFFNVGTLAYLWGLNSWIPTYLIEAKGFNLKQFGNLSMIPFVAMLVGEILGAFNSDRFPNRRAIQVFGGLLGAGITMFLLIYQEGIVNVLIFMSASAFLWGFNVSAIFALLANITAKEVATTAGGIFNGFGNFGSALAPVIIGYIVVYTGNINHGIMFLAGIAIVSSLFLIPLLKKY
ncbi:MFS transporter [uncultured Psychrobacter sp.]|uniref:MFS transporter n=1 Tax=uncultured Psychrobacter sp. TaxID=259303 RepID=UPI003459EB25